MRQSRLSWFFRFRFGLMALLLVVLLVLVLGLVTLSGKHEYEHNYIVNILGRQRMLSQQMAKEASRLAAIYEALSSTERMQSEATLLAKIGQVKTSLRDAAERFERTLGQARSGELPYGDKSLRVFQPGDREAEEAVVAVAAAWKDFRPRVEAVLESSTNDRPFREALIHINENNEELLARSERLSDLAFRRFVEEGIKAERRFTALIVLLVAMGVLLLYGTYRMVVEPLAFFYRGLKTLGSVPAPEPRESLSPLVREVSDSISLLRGLVSLIGEISQGASFQDTLGRIYSSFKPHIPYDYIGVATFVGYQGTRLAAAYGMSDGSFPGLPDRLLGLTADLGTTSLGAILASNQPRVIDDLEAYAAARPMQDYTRIILEEGIRSSITLPLSVNGKALGFIFFSSRERRAYNDVHFDFLRNLRDALALSFEKDLFVDDLVYSSTLALAKMAEARDEDTADHLERMRQYSALLARAAREEGAYTEQLTPELLRAIERFSPMHDIGKVGIRDGVLLKPGKLDPDEMAHMRTHAIYGADVLREAENNIARSGRSIFAPGIRIAHSHHERWDGSGYPERLAGEAIPLEARVVSVADVFDALTTRRPYKEPFDFELSVRMIVEAGGSQFDPLLIEVFSRRLEEFQRLYLAFKERSPESY